MSKLKVFLSDSFNPHLNLATEEWIFHNLDPSYQILFIWRNEETVVIGRNQNPWSECNLARMKDDSVHLARRTTGGGAVFHDLGNTNFTFLSPKENYNRDHNTAIILSALKSFGIEGFTSGRNDLLIPFPDGPRKFSGSAYREKRDRAFHHGTLLLHADLTRLGNYLTPNPKKLQAKGKESVRARVANLSELEPSIKHEAISSALIQSFESFYKNSAEQEMLNLSSLKTIPELNTQFENLASFAWLFGNTMEFNQQMSEYLSLGFFDFQFKIVDAVISDLKIFTDCLYPALIDDLTSSLRSQPFTGATIRTQLAHAKTHFPELSQGLTEIESWLCTQIEV